MNIWAKLALLVIVFSSAEAFLIGSNTLKYTHTAASILYILLFLFGFFFWKALGTDMHENAQG